MADDTLRDRIADALVASWSVAEDPKSRAVARRAAERNADTVMAVVEDEAIERMAETFVAESRLKSMDFRNGVTMDMEPARELAANFVAAARTMLGGAENYSETPIEMEVGLAGEMERYAFIVQRVGKLTPHQARRLADERADQAEAILARVRTFAGGLRDYCSPHGVSAVYADQLEAILNGGGN